jgi:thymidine kinase
MLRVIGGPMFAGKTTWLLNFAKSLPEGTFQVFKPSMDVRYASDECVTHNGTRLPARNLDVQNPQIPELDPKIKTILLDELNFFNAETLLPVIREQEKLGRTVAGVGLLFDSEKRPFGATLSLAEVADDFVQLYARCDECGKQAEHTYRKLLAESQVVLGASELYGPCCSNCFELLHKRAEQETAAVSNPAVAFSQ